MMQDKEMYKIHSLYSSRNEASANGKAAHICHLDSSLVLDLLALSRGRLWLITLLCLSINLGFDRTIYFRQISWTSMKGKLSMEGFMRRDTMHCLCDILMVSK